MYVPRGRACNNTTPKTQIPCVRGAREAAWAYHHFRLRLSFTSARHQTEATFMAKTPTPSQIKKLRSRQWFDNPENPDMTALYLERYIANP